MFFKELYPNAEILCFEPDPNAFQALQENIAINKIAGTQLLNFALSRKEGEINFFGQMFVDSPDARGNSIIDTWGLQRTISHAIKVKSVRLSSYINSEVDFLKLDIEGAEQQVLEDLEQENKLPLIREMSIEVHQSDKIKQINDISVITNLLTRNQFDIKIFEKDPNTLSLEQIANWAKKTNPHLFVIQATRL